MKVRRSPASFPRGRGTAVGAQAEHSESGARLACWGRVRDLISHFHYLRSEKRCPGEQGCHTGDCQHLWVDNGRKDSGRLRGRGLLPTPHGTYLPLGQALASL